LVKFRFKKNKKIKFVDNLNFQILEQKKLDFIDNYFKKVKVANKEATKISLFKDLLNRLYSTDNEILKTIDQLSSGTEKSILNIPRKDKLHRGSADTLYSKIIIEFENNLGITGEHAKEQLAGYLLGQFNSGEGYNFTLISSDCINWKVYAPDITQLNSLENIQEQDLILNEIETASFTLTDKNYEEFYYWIDRFLFKEEKQKATLKRIEESFGYQSNVFIDSYRELIKHFETVKGSGEVQVAFEEWKKFLSIAYGKFDASENNFIVHTFLSVFSKMLAYAVVSNDDYIDDDEMKGIISGKIFDKYKIQNFVDNDFFHWIGSENNFKKLKKVYRLIAQEISSFDFHDVEEDILKGVYQELIDLDTRHSLGEYYTPDWLCERVVNEFNFKKTDKILDPSCGSGSFLRAALHKIKKQNSNITIEELSNNIFGIDIHPLSVQIAKTTLLLAFGKEISKLKKPIHINVILANTLLSPEGVTSLFGSEFAMEIDKHRIWINTQVLEDSNLFDQALEVCEDLAEQSLNKKIVSLTTFENNLKKKYSKGGYSDIVIEGFYKVYETFKKVKEEGRDSIWKFIIQNLYKPYFLYKKFDYIIGNPPWFTYSSINNLEYQNTLESLAKKYDVKPIKTANFPHLEIAAIFMSYCSSYFLKDNAKIAFVLPRSFFSADHHDNTRAGKSKGFRITQIWDLDKVKPLFRVPSCVLFAEQANVKLKIPTTGVSGISFKANLPEHNCNYTIAEKKIIESENQYYYITQGKSSAFATENIKGSKKENPYKKQFKQGATIVPRAFYFIELNEETPEDWEDRIINIKTSKEIQTDAKKPWKDLHFEGNIESDFIFRTALSKSILPFAMYNPDLVVLPIIIDNENKINLKSSKEILENGFSDASKWFANAEKIWDNYKTENNKDITSYNYLNWQNKLIQQNLNAPYLVLYNSSAKDANATVVKREDLDLHFIAESVTYVYYTENLNEAYYLTAILNSETPNLMMKNFQAKGLFGERHVHKKILDIYYPKFSEKDKIHVELAGLSLNAHQKVAKYLQNSENLKYNLGKLRTEIKKHISEELKEIDSLVSKLIK